MTDETHRNNIRPIPPLPEPIKTHFPDDRIPKDPQAYQLGDDINDYLYSNVKYLRILPAEYQTKCEEILNSERVTLSAILNYAESKVAAIEKSREVVAQTERFKALRLMADAIRDRRETIKSQTPMSRQSSKMSSPEASSVMGRNRMQAVDVSTLPAGFGKRRSTASAGVAKRPKSPTEGAPELKRPTPTDSPEQS
jgi:hypothetical protein